MGYHRIPDSEDNDPSSKATSGKGRYYVAVAIGLCFVFGTIALSSGRETSDTSSLITTDEKLVSGFMDVSLTVSNEYERANGRKLGDGMYPYEHLIQTNAATLLELSGEVVADWDITFGPDTEPIFSIMGRSTISFTFSLIGVYTVTVSDGTHYKSFTVNSKAIRYELRSLNDGDRNAYFKALHTFYTTSQTDGELKYGSSYKSSSYILRQHIYGAAQRECDHWHDGAGMLTHHVGVTWEFELSLRLIDDTTAAHYWDYTIEASEGVNWYDSIIFDADWFGDNSPSNVDHIVNKGRFAYTPVLENARGFSSITNPYGLLRSPWNTNPTPYLMRHNRTMGDFADSNDKFPSCSDFASEISGGNISFADLVSAINGELHGPVHIMIGGHWGFHAHEDVWNKIGKLATKYGIEIADDSFLLFSKYLWRQGFVRLPEYCSSDTPHEECMAHCPTEITAGYNATEILLKAGYNSVVASFFPSEAEMILEDMEEVRYVDKMVLEVLCAVGSPGEMYTSAAPQDPTFWPLHGNAERYVQLIRILKQEGVIDFNETWGYTHINSASDTHVVCNWTEADASEDEFAMPTCTSGICSGHKEEDLLPFTDLTSDQTSLYSNGAFWDLISPLEDNTPYAYDGLKLWLGCNSSNLLVESGLV